jgi:hypothetical protein
MFPDVVLRPFSAGIRDELAPPWRARPMLRHGSIHVQAMCAGCHHFSCFQLTEQVPVYSPCPCPWACSGQRRGSIAERPLIAQDKLQRTHHICNHFRRARQSPTIRARPSKTAPFQKICSAARRSVQSLQCCARSLSVGNGDLQHTLLSHFGPLSPPPPSQPIARRPMHVFVPGHACFSTSVRVARH